MKWIAHAARAGAKSDLGKHVARQGFYERRVVGNEAVYQKLFGEDTFKSMQELLGVAAASTSPAAGGTRPSGPMG